MYEKMRDAKFCPFFISITHFYHVWPNAWRTIKVGQNFGRNFYAQKKMEIMSSKRWFYDWMIKYLPHFQCYHIPLKFCHSNLAKNGVFRTMKSTPQIFRTFNFNILPHDSLKIVPLKGPFVLESLLKYPLFLVSHWIGPIRSRTPWTGPK